MVQIGPLDNCDWIIRWSVQRSEEGIKIHVTIWCLVHCFVLLTRSKANQWQGQQHHLENGLRHRCGHLNFEDG
jgi:hypothetical protein